MSLKNQKRIAADIMGCSPHRVWFNPEQLSEIEEAITKADLRGLISQGIIKAKPVAGISRGRTRADAAKRRRGQGKGHGSRKGKKTARLPRKDVWMSRIRSQRRLLAELREKGEVDGKTYRMLYMRAKGGFFRSMRHIMLYIQEQLKK